MKTEIHCGINFYQQNEKQTKEFFVYKNINILPGTHAVFNYCL